jgi:hypothetical protein
MTMFSPQIASIGVLVAQRPGVPGGPIPAHHASIVLGAFIVIFIVMLVALIRAAVWVVRELASAFCNLLMSALSIVAPVLLSVVLITGVSMALLIHR